MFEVRFSPSLALPQGILLRGLPVAFLMISTVRVIMLRRRNEEDPTQPFGRTPFLITRFITISWAASALFVPVVSPVFPGQFVPEQDNILLMLAIMIMCFGIRLQWDSVGLGSFTTILHDFRADAVAQQIRLLFVPQKGWTVALEVLAFVLYGLPVIIVLLRWASGYIPPAVMDWLIVGSRSCASVSVAVLWFAVRRANQNMVNVLKDSLEVKTA